MKLFPLFAAVSLFLSPMTISLAQEASPKLSDGSAQYFEKDKIWVTPPAGWEILENKFGKAVILQEPKPEDVVYGVATYQRNITVAVSNESTPIDETTIAQLRESLQETFGKYGQDFTLATDHELFDYRTEKDGVIIYSFLKVNGYDLTQLHVYVSGSSQNVLLTYTDLTDKFDAESETFAQAWNALTSIQVEGVPEPRFQKLILIGSVSGGLFLLILLVSMIRYYRAKKAYESEEDVLFSDDDAASSADDEDYDDDEDDAIDLGSFDDFDNDHEDLPKTVTKVQTITSW
ncbi:MAG: hypothetical protein HRU19_06090 [Pseudobacteriovorax sp.]|nr:hypothetical protein [Pseudobacteriovorax sp.]